MANTITMLGASQNQVVQARSGTVYTAVNGIFSNVAIGLDIVDIIDAGGTTIDSPEQQPVLPLVKGRFYGVPQGVTPAAVLTVTGTLYAYPVFIPNVVSVATLNLSVTTGQTGGAAHLGIYQDNAGYPGALIYDTGTITGLTSTAVSTTTPTTPPVLQPGWYWFATTFSASSTMPSVIGGGTTYTQQAPAILGADTAAHALATSAQNATGISVAFTYGALPALFPPSATLTLGAATPIFAIGV